MLDFVENLLGHGLELYFDYFDVTNLQRHHCYLHYGHEST